MIAWQVGGLYIGNDYSYYLITNNPFVGCQQLGGGGGGGGGGRAQKKKKKKIKKYKKF